MSQSSGSKTTNNPLAEAKRAKAVSIKYALPSDLSTYTAEQVYIAHRILVEKRNCLINGAGGTGKTWLSRELMAHFRQNGIAFIACAATGVAAQLLGGVTAYQAFGLKPSQEYRGPAPSAASAAATPPALTKAGKERKVRENKNCVNGIILKSLWPLSADLLAADLILMDEISMFSDDLFAAMDQRCRRMCRRPNEAFGGKQVVCVGDVCQLPPVNGSYCFQTQLFRSIFDRDCCFRLQTQMRQRGDPTFAMTLNALRRGTASQHDLDLLNERVFIQPHLRPDPRVVPYLFTTNRQANEHNVMCLGLFTGRQVSWPIIRNAAPGFEFLVDNKPDTPVEMTLKVGAPVFLTRNFNVKSRLVNGSPGVVVDMVSTCSLGINKCLNPGCRYCTGESPLERHQIMRFEDDTHVGLGPSFYRLLPLVEFNKKPSQRYVVMSAVNAITRPAPKKQRKAQLGADGSVAGIMKTTFPSGDVDGVPVSHFSSKRPLAAMASGGGQVPAARAKQTTLSFGQSPQASSASSAASSSSSASASSSSSYFPAASTASPSSLPTTQTASPPQQAGLPPLAFPTPHTLLLPEILQKASAAYAAMQQVESSSEGSHDSNAKGDDDPEALAPFPPKILTVLANAINKAKASEENKQVARETVLAYTESIPLILACGVTVHKAQGLSLEEVAMDLSGAFAEGQAYVALSRATRLAGLYLLRPLPASSVRCSPHALECEDRCIVAGDYVSS